MSEVLAGGAFTIVGAAIPLIGPYVANRMPVLRSDPRRAHLTGQWVGRYIPGGGGDTDFDRPGHMQLALNAKRNLITGTAEFLYTRDGHAQDFKFAVKGSLLFSRFLRVNYIEKRTGLMHFGSIVFELNGDVTELRGRYVGYGGHSNQVVHGEMRLVKKSGALS